MFRPFSRASQSEGDRIDDLLSAYLDGMLASDERFALEARLQREPALRNRLDGLRLTVRALSGLPEAETPRNFLLSPAVAGPRPVARPRHRATWPVFGWATAAATLLFLLVFAADVFRVAPSVRSRATTPAVEQEQSVVEAPAEGMEQTPAEELEAALPTEGELMEVPAPAEGEAPLEAAADMVEGVTTPAAEMKAVAAEPVVATAVVEAAAPPTEAPAATPSDRLLRATPAPTMEAVQAASDEAVTTEVTAALGAVMSETLMLEATVVVTPALPVTQSETVAPVATMLPGTPETGEGDRESLTAPEQFATASPAALAVAPVTVKPETGGAERAEGAPGWLRLLEVGLGAAVLVLASATLIMRWRGW
jgi:anti-sigma factor RsiW